MEEIVFNQMKDILADINVCKCEKCLMDIAAIALNDLPQIILLKRSFYSKINTLMQH